MNRGDMEGLLSHYHPNCGDGGRDGRKDGRIDLIVVAVVVAAVAEIHYCYYTVRKSEWPLSSTPNGPAFLPSFAGEGRGATPRNAASISLPIPSLYENKRMDGRMARKGLQLWRCTSDDERINDWN